MTKSHKINHAAVLASFFILFIPIDMVSGVLRINGFLSVSAPYKSLVLFISIIYLCGKKKGLQMCALFALISIVFLMHFVAIDDAFLAFRGLDMMLRFSAIIIFYMLFSVLVRKGHVDYLFTIAFASFLGLVFNVLLGALGLGSGMYKGVDGGSVGTRGLIYAGNELSVAIVVSGAILMMQALEKSSYLKFSILGLVMLILSIFLTTKVAIFGVAMLVIWLPVAKVFKEMKRFRIPKRASSFLLVVFFAMPFLAAFTFHIVFFHFNLGERLLFFYEKVGLTTLMFSHRNIWAIEALGLFRDYNLVEFFFGTGRDWWGSMSGNKMVEIDAVDFLMSYGFFGLISLCFFILFSITSTIRNFNKPYAVYVLIVLMLLAIISSTAGHVFNSGTAGFLVALLLALSNYKLEDRCNIKQ